jgi:alkanesulfonate monooxygenase SsuD/methylene tetrahydromethanopterin reductase-like flavin-dependent oxidoreductase (luciferase family)
VRVGVTLPQFRDDAEAALDAAQRAEELGLHGVFIFDHLWPMGRPDGAIIAAVPLMAAIAADTSSIAVASLVMRVGLLPTRALVEGLLTVNDISGGRLIAGLGTGDHLSEAENLAFGVPYAPARERRAELADCARQLAGAGVPVWIGAGSAIGAAARRVAGELGVAVNLWDSAVSALEGEHEVEVTWGGPVPGDVAAIAAHLSALAAAGATWAVCARPESLESVAEAMDVAGIGRGDRQGRK